MFDVREVLLSHVVPFEDERINPLEPTVTKELFPYVTPQRVTDVPEVLLSHVVPLSEEVRIVPELPHVINNSGVLSVEVLEVLEVELCSSSLAQEIIFSAKRDTRLMKKIFFIFLNML